jgi:hypothetical protein
MQFFFFFLSVVTTKFSPNKAPSATRTPFIKAPLFPKAKSSSPPPTSSSDGADNTLIHTVLRLSLNHIDKNRSNSPIEEPDNSSSPLPDSNDSSLISETDDRKRSSSVQKVKYKI